jgi:cytochrome c peroxidase
MKSSMPLYAVACAALLAGGTLWAGGAAESESALAIPRGLAAPKVPDDNSMTAAKVELGKQLYFDPRLSRDNTVSCASCHNPALGWSNGERFATGVRGQVGGRSAPTIINAAYQHFQFWDGRALGLEGQALGPIQNPIEMDLSLKELEEKLNKIEGYRRQFREVFGTDATSDGVAKAIAAFERTILSGDAPYDRYRAGEADALSEAAQRGMRVFFNKAQCTGCHVPPGFTDGAFHNIGIGMNDKEPDVGRYAKSPARPRTCTTAVSTRWKTSWIITTRGAFPTRSSTKRFSR